MEKREERFLRAWKCTENPEHSARMHLRKALESYERAVIMDEWDGDIPIALEMPESRASVIARQKYPEWPDSTFGNSLDFGGTDSNY